MIGAAKRYQSYSQRYSMERKLAGGTLPEESESNHVEEARIGGGGQ